MANTDPEMSRQMAHGGCCGHGPWRHPDLGDPDADALMRHRLRQVGTRLSEPPPAPGPSDVEVIDWALTHGGWVRSGPQEWGCVGVTEGRSLAAALPEMRRQWEEAHAPAEPDPPGWALKAVWEMRDAFNAWSLMYSTNPHYDETRESLARIIARHAPCDARARGTRKECDV